MTSSPKNGLGYYRILSPSAGIRVSPLFMGSLNFGEAWKGFMGECNKQTTFEILDHFYENGGNFIDTANNHQQEESEKWIGEWMESRGVRDRMVVATKVGPSRLTVIDLHFFANLMLIRLQFTSNYCPGDDAKTIKSNYTGNNTKSMFTSLKTSLKKLKTSYIDIVSSVRWQTHLHVAC
jgi:aryl-alcohol dehydrogenase-like predicted oxidoreductase